MKRIKKYMRICLGTALISLTAWWTSISMDNPALPYLKEIVNLVNVDSLVTTVFTADEDEKNVGEDGLVGCPSC